jgi:hypothetical protein
MDRRRFEVERVQTIQNREKMPRKKNTSSVNIKITRLSTTTSTDKHQQQSTIDISKRTRQYTTTNNNNNYYYYLDCIRLYYYYYPFVSLIFKDDSQRR